MRIIGRFLDQRQVSSLVDTLKNDGFDRKDMIITDSADDNEFHDAEDATQNGMIFIKSETDSLTDFQSFTTGIKGLKSKEGIIVSVDTSKRESSRVRSFMEESGAVEILQD